ncbi:hypothetical protein SODALDRAFT_333058 [Sodiomyces alkalinus F11]|uniref:C3H1-type domain-containing protein n=1 Tax=Sodiomyces alkalinus (strain CBS 110278 / VKM F-3762 / F11) TaxID=1314773 RepID=A0A3N2PVD8_SODAK|nr:hypothetical protein SODALDRAFT_333058 [Sodiomyces alkalinus F11]ROT38471.1 hypothetical protein SODALDRAFT_333058 [Sodiomyces alkalinus F11]
MLTPLQELISQYENLKKAYADKCADYNNEVESRRMWQSKASIAMEEKMAITRATESNPFVYAIIDGDGAIFNDNLLAKGAEGGAEAAYLLQTAIKSYIKDAYPQTNTGDWTIIVQVILNLDGLAKKLHACGIIPNTPEKPTLAGFARAFGRSQPLFSFIDVGGGKESADHKIREMMRLMVRVSQCKHVFFGPCSDNGYLPVLEPYKRDDDVFHRFTLLETVPAQPGFLDLGFNTASFPTVFRSDLLPSRPLVQALPPASISSSVNGIDKALQRSHPHSLPHPLPPAAAAPSPSPAPSQLSLPGPPKTPKPSQVPAPSEPSGDQQASPVTATATTTTSSSAGGSWSTITRIIPSANPKAIDIRPTKKAPRKYYLLNADSERIDEPLPRIDPNAERKFKDMMADNGTNFCNNHYLLGGCDTPGCTYYHGEKLPPAVLLVLKQKVRGIPCEMKSACDNVDCIYAHHCRWARNCPMSSCRFSFSHNMDTTPRIKIFNDNTVQHIGPNK